MIEFADWLPDQPALARAGEAGQDIGAVTVAEGVVPAARGYRPFAQLVPVTGALAGPVLGAGTAQDPAGRVQVFAGTPAGLFRASGNGWENVSRAGGYGVSAPPTWGFTDFGRDLLATNGTDPVQIYTLGTSATFTDLAETAPKARLIATVRDFVMLGDTTDPADGHQQSRVWWSGFNNPLAWPTPGSVEAAQVQSDHQTFPSGGTVQAMTGAVGGADGAVFLDRAVYRIAYEGPPTVFGFYEVERLRGTVAGGSVVNVGPAVFYLSEDGFYLFDGAGSAPIGADKVDRWFWGTVDESRLGRVCAASDPVARVVAWAFASKNSLAGILDTILLYHWPTRRWAVARDQVDYLFRALTRSLTLEDLDAFGSLDGLPLSLDNRAWRGGQLALAAFDDSHRLGYFTGPNRAAVLETSDLNGDGVGRRIFVQGARPLIDGAAATMRLRHRDSLTAPLTDGAGSAAGLDGICPFRISTRYARFRLDLPAGAAWTSAIGVEPIYRPEGRR